MSHHRIGAESDREEQVVEELREVDDIGEQLFVGRSVVGLGMGQRELDLRTEPRQGTPKLV